ncbi:MAG: sugar ABC transporter permease, partial [Firmicutes bacterium]|nr:sugar ABC transporter permease [Bacillota bacterium]
NGNTFWNEFHWNKWQSYTPYLFIAPFMILLCTFTVYTIIRGAFLSMTDAQSINPGSWIGLANFKELLRTDEFRKSMLHTFWFTVGALATQVPTAFLLAFVLNSITKGRAALQAIFVIPCVVNTVITALLFRMLFNKDVGLINWFLGLLHLPNNIDWVTIEPYAIPLMVIVSYWQWTGFHMIYFLAQLQAIDPCIYEVAKLDGASTLRTMFQITIPLMRHAFTYVVITATVGCFQVFEYPFLIFPNAGFGPGKAAETMMCFIWYHGFNQQFRLGFATAAGWILFLIVLTVSIFQLKTIGFGQVGEE